MMVSSEIYFRNKFQIDMVHKMGVKWPHDLAEKARHLSLNRLPKLMINASFFLDLFNAA